MQKKAFILGTLASVPFLVHSTGWFETNTPLTQAHQNLLTNDLESMFASLVEVWQLEQNQNIQTHLNDLLIQSLSVDCGKGLQSKPFPEWIKSITITNVDIQSPGRDAYQVLVEAQTNKELVDVKLTKWVKKPLSTDVILNLKGDNVTNDWRTYLKRYNLNTKLPIGLYRLDITANDQESWSSWVIFGEPKAKQTVRWASKDKWVVDKNALLNRYCPLPKLDVSVFDYIDSEYKEIWTKSYESDYPTELELTSLASDRYVLAVSMTHQRWQGAITIEQAQVISKTYNVSLEE
ncbi:DUF2861 family protein [Vibrio cincinnatiensis]|uniref:DUF2861 domain-containing protein n=1 Tax=Vibrio cincinnatiensis DSM 19608 TaxID=1123491 RepID=A0A1T4KP59_VIBCI|nr:DUF2861 family protein [Vibrio cincinnatiensis]MCG3721392.1 DUF2861 family protein [Vibrio cincinnatiensis]MCG3736274.1 DUF2861 family protein [Vibrio cincinnatiensis]MCG3747310.1 DUF2861 family protein [Vibrio cincinnatiensis]SJZ44205.1 Protein of unknown function [Vibrio cincinnatiensis DSM 19608]SUP48516.1 copper-sensing two-component system response regulator CusR [Vibrio cincinnatiensis]